MKIKKTMFVCQLPSEIQKQITVDLVFKIASPSLNKLEIKALVSEALDSRLCDLTEIIDINKYLTK